MRNIIFYFPYRGVGGVSLLFKRLSSLLTNRFNVYLVDFVDGFMGRSISESVNFIDIETVITYPSNSIVVFQSIPSWNIIDACKFPAETRILFWNLHPLNLYPNIFSIYTSNKLKKKVAKALLWISFFRKRRLEKLVEYLNKKNAIFFMDGENFKKTSEFYPRVNFQRRFLPIFSNPGRLVEHTPKEQLRCCWIGRIVDFKVHILGHLIERLDSAISNVGPIELIIVGNGDSYDDLMHYVREVSSLKITLIDEVHADELDSFLSERVDIQFAMGTSALEAASKGVPTFLLDYSFVKISGLYCFQYIYEASDYSVGEEIDISKLEKKSSLEEKLLKCRRDYRNIGLKTYEYWRANFSPEFVESEFIHMVNLSTATIGEMRDLGFFRPDIISLVVKKTLLKLKKTKQAIHGFGEC